MEAIERLLEALDNDECNRLIGKTNKEYSELISPAVIAWQAMLFAGLRLDPAIEEKIYESDLTKLMGHSMIVLGSIIQYAYALGIRRGSRERRRKQ